MSRLLRFIFLFPIGFLVGSLGFFLSLFEPIHGDNLASRCAKRLFRISDSIFESNNYD